MGEAIFRKYEEKRQRVYRRKFTATTGELTGVTEAASTTASLHQAPKPI